MMHSRETVASDRGFTLIELLVGMVVTLIVTGGALLAFQQASRINDGSKQRLEMDDNLRVALDLMVRDFIEIGDGLPNGKTIPVPNGPGASLINRPGPNMGTFPAGTSSLTAVIPGHRRGPQINGVRNDVITLLYVDPAFDGDPNDEIESGRACRMAANGRSCVFDTDVSAVADPLLAGDILMVTPQNGTNSTMLLVTSVSPGNTANFDDMDAMRLNQPNAPGGSVSQINPGNTWFWVTACRVRMITYWNQIQTPGTDRLALMRQVGFNTPQRVASGIEALMLTYDLVDGVTETAVEDPSQDGREAEIRKINITMVARSAQRYRNTNDFLRTSLSTQVSLRGLALVDRYN